MMINEIELRIGNMVLAPRHFSETKGLTSEMNDLVPYRISYITEHQSGATMYEPIKLSSELLEQCGFERMNPYDVWSNGKVGIAELKDGYAISRSVPFKYLHQLQNLYYCYCGEELNLKTINPIN